MMKMGLSCQNHSSHDMFLWFVALRAFGNETLILLCVTAAPMKKEPKSMIVGDIMQLKKMLAYMRKVSKCKS